MHATLPQLFLAFPLLRQIFIRERVQIVHAHVALSALGLEAVLHARTMGLKAVFTDHSLLGLGGFGEMWGNKMLKGCLSDIEAVICVSHTGCVLFSFQSLFLMYIQTREHRHQSSIRPKDHTRDTISRSSDRIQSRSSQFCKPGRE